METLMNELLARIIAAHGGMDRWNWYERIDATIVSGGGLFPLKGLIQDPNPRRMSVWLHRHSAQPPSACCIAKPTLGSYMLLQQSTSP
jgi:hypothetical protein